MLIPQKTKTAEITIKNSRFIAEASPISKPEHARTIIKEKRLEHPGANHVVHAFIIGKSAEISGCSDDREPPGTAGRPVLEILKGSSITNIIVTVVRYFGGTKLGTGGLVQAYSEAAKAVLEILPTVELKEKYAFKTEIPYDIFDQTRIAMNSLGAEIRTEDFSTLVTISGTIPEESAELLNERITTLSRGKNVVYFSKEEEA